MSCARSCLPKPAGIRCLHLQSTSSAATRFESPTGYIVYPTSHQNSTSPLPMGRLCRRNGVSCRFWPAGDFQQSERVTSLHRDVTASSRPKGDIVYGIHTILLKKVRECACRRFTFFA